MTIIGCKYKDKQVLPFCFAIQYQSPGTLVEMSNTRAMPDKLCEQSVCTAFAGISDRVAKEIEMRRVPNYSLIGKHTKITRLYRIND